MNGKAVEISAYVSDSVNKIKTGKPDSAYYSWCYGILSATEMLVLFCLHVVLRSFSSISLSAASFVVQFLTQESVKKPQKLPRVCRYC